MKKIFAFVFLPIRFLLLCLRLASLAFSKGDHLYLKLPSKFSDSYKSFLLKKFQGEEDPPFLTDFLEYLSIVKSDKRIRSISIEIPKLHMGFSEVYSIYKELISIRDSGVTLKGYAEEGDLKSLILLSICQKRYSSETGEFQSILPSIDAMFFGEIAKKWDVKVDVFQSGAYKSFGEIFTRKEFSKEARSNLQSLIDDHKEEIFSCIPIDSHLTKEVTHRPLIHSGKLKDIGFLDGLLEIDAFREHYLQANPVEYIRSWEVIESSRDNDNERKEFLNSHKPFSKPIQKGSILSKRGVKTFRILGDNRINIAILPMKGQIVSGKPEETEPKSGIIEGNSIIQVISELKENSRIQAVVLEIDSPGGSASESEKIFQAIKNLDRKKPVYAYMSNTCASGGYYIACAARKIYSSPLSTVGSIGTIMMRFNFEGIYNKIGISKDKIGFYPMREIYSDTGKLSKESVQFLKLEIKRVENLFLRRVEESRKISSGLLASMAGGRVFNAKRFADSGLSDGIASLSEVLEFLNRDEFNSKSYKVLYLAPRYNLKLAIRNSSPLGIGRILAESSYIIPTGLYNFLKAIDRNQGNIQHLWLGGISCRD